ncbi:TetR/AcrR family transcriptional regulator [Lysinibacillus sp. NPDC097287]|uniref:TetR/AcrR family transcriptional regulator n=1 Tax=Lysinibacillus sp. NPDC097287 TaxID=3364144 RepID=UPI0037F8333A
MFSKASQKRTLIIQTAIQYIQENDLNSLTLDGVAGKAGISKGGLLYHFKTKDALQSAIAETIMEEVMQSYEEFASQEHGVGRLTRGFILGSRKDLMEGARLNIAIQIMQNEHSSISEEYEHFLEDLMHDGLEESSVHLIRLTLDGLYYSKLLNIAPVSEEIAEKVFEQLLQMARKDNVS